MIKAAGNFFINLAFVLVLLHSMVPHHHQEEASDPNCIEANQPQSLLDFIASFFHIDFGEKHLEDFRDNGSLASFMLPAHNSYSLPFQAFVLVINSFQNPAASALDAYARSLSLRAPPYFW